MQRTGNLEVRLIGQFEIKIGGEPVLIPSRAAQSLFAYLILTAGTLHRREKLAGMFWPDVTEEKARTYLRQELWRIRKAFSTKSTIDYLIADDINIRFDSSTDYWLDVLSVTGVPENASVEELMEALSVFQGELLPGFYDDWVILEREHLRTVYEQKMTLLLELLGSEKRWPDMLEWADRWISLGDGPEAAYRALMVAYDALGDRARVASTYERCVKALGALGLEPSDATLALAFKRNLSLNIPIPLTSFIGREKELEDVAGLLSKSRLVTLTGTGGVGKTRLAIQVVAEIMDRFPHGVWFLDLAPLSDPDLVPIALASLLGFRESIDTQSSLVDRLIDSLGTRTALLIFDNCEHLIVSCAQLVNLLLLSCPNLSVLATSREPLRVSGEIHYRVPSLSVPKPDMDFSTTEFSHIDSVALFVERAALASPGLALHLQNAVAIAQICQRLDGIPLAIELAAARTNVLTVEGILTRLDDRFNLLTNGMRTALPRQQTLRATIEWSYSLLPEKERILFRRLAVFTGGWTLEAAEKVSSGEGIQYGEMLDLLSQLVNKSLVVVKTEGIENRYRRLEIIREFAREKLIEATEAGRLQDKHLAYFLDLAEQAEPDSRGVSDPAMLDQLEVERDNMRLALQWALETGAAEKALRMAAALGWFWHSQSDYAEGRHWLDRALASGTQVSPKVRANALMKAGDLAMLQGDYQQATALMEESCQLYTALQDAQGMASIFNLLGVIGLYQGNYEQADKMFSQSLALFEKVEDGGGIASQDLYLGMVACYQGDLERAKALMEQSLPVLRELGDVITTARALHGLGLVERRLGDYARARALFEESLASARQRHGRLEMITAVEGLGSIACANGQLVRATRLYGAAEALRSVIDAPLRPGIRGDYDRDVQLLRNQLNEQTFAKSWAEGRSLTFEQAMDYALMNHS